jgi:hypothetical protein
MVLLPTGLAITHKPTHDAAEFSIHARDSDEGKDGNGDNTAQ